MGGCERSRAGGAWGGKQPRPSALPGQGSAGHCGGAAAEVGSVGASPRVPPCPTAQPVEDRWPSAEICFFSNYLGFAILTFNTFFSAVPCSSPHPGFSRRYFIREAYKNKGRRRPAGRARKSHTGGAKAGEGWEGVAGVPRWVRVKGQSSIDSRELFGLEGFNGTELFRR